MKNLVLISAFTCFITAVKISAQCGPLITCPSNINVNADPGQCGATVSYTATALNQCPAGTTNVFSENFQAGVGAWTLNVSTGTNAATPNSWEVNDSEGGVAPPGCGVATNGDLTLHITCTSIFCGSLITGAVYNATKTSNKRAESPAFSSLGYTGLTLNFDFISNGEGLNDNASVLYNDGTGWQVLTASIKSPVCGSGQGKWTAYTATLPPSCDNNANVKIGFNWTNNNNNIGTDPSIAINNITVTTPLTLPPPVLTYVPASGSTFPIGTTSVTATATDVNLLTSTCTFSVTVVDNELPQITNCPSSISVNANNAGCSAIVTWTEPTATDNCMSGLTFVPNFPSGSVFPLGTTPVTYTATDANGNLATCSFNVTVLNDLQVSASSNDPLCNGDNTGTASVNVSGGTPAYSYSWLPSGASTATANNLTAGIQTCNVSDANGCVISQSVILTDPALISSSQTLTICEGQSVLVGINTYMLAGNYTDILNSVNGCDSTVSTSLIVNPILPITLNLGAVDTLCLNSGSISLLSSVSPTGGVWTGPGISGNNFDPSVAGTGTHLITYTMTNVNGCVSDTTGIIYVDLCTGFENSITNLQSTFFPNPNSGTFTLNASENCLLEIYSANGQLIFTQQIVMGNNSIVMEHTAKGLYVVKLTGKENSTHLKMMVVE
ncbi:hypothetical protein BH09BAC5_BH09BAC5_27680 [soil metagenome]